MPLPDSRKLNLFAGAAFGCGAVIGYALRALQTRDREIKSTIAIDCPLAHLTETIGDLREFPHSDVKIKTITRAGSETFHILLTKGRGRHGDLAVKAQLKEASGKPGSELQVSTSLRGWQLLGRIRGMNVDRVLQQFVKSVKQMVEGGVANEPQPTARHVIEGTHDHISEIEHHEHRTLVL